MSTSVESAYFHNSGSIERSEKNRGSDADPRPDFAGHTAYVCNACSSLRPTLIETAHEGALNSRLGSV
jgi:hypothetical protein